MVAESAATGVVVRSARRLATTGKNRSFDEDNRFDDVLSEGQDVAAPGGPSTSTARAWRPAGWADGRQSLRRPCGLAVA